MNVRKDRTMPNLTPLETAAAVSFLLVTAVVIVVLVARAAGRNNWTW